MQLRERNLLWREYTTVCGKSGEQNEWRIGINWHRDLRRNLCWNIANAPKPQTSAAGVRVSAAAVTGTAQFNRSYPASAAFTARPGFNLGDRIELGGCVTRIEIRREPISTPMPYRSAHVPETETRSSVLLLHHRHW